MCKQMDIFDFIEKPQQSENEKTDTLFERLFAKINDPVIQCANCLCERCVNNVEELWHKVKPEEQIDPCFNCDDCYHYDMSLKHKPRQMDNCEKFVISEYAAMAKRKRIKVIKKGEGM